MDHPEPKWLLDDEEGATVPVIRRRPAVANGFTLIELIVTITLLGILVALGLPSFTAWIRNSQVRSVAEALQNGLRTAQTEAVRRNRQVVMSFTDDANPLDKNPNTVVGGKKWVLQTVASAFAADPEVTLIASGSLADVASGVAISGPSTGAICFNSSGRLVDNTNPTSSPSTAKCTATAATTFNITQTNADRPLQVTVAVGGQVRMCDPHRPALSSTSPDGC